MLLSDSTIQVLGIYVYHVMSCVTSIILWLVCICLLGLDSVDGHII